MAAKPPHSRLSAKDCRDFVEAAQEAAYRQSSFYRYGFITLVVAYATGLGLKALGFAF